MWRIDLGLVEEQVVFLLQIRLIRPPQEVLARERLAIRVLGVGRKARVHVAAEHVGDQG